MYEYILMLNIGVCIIFYKKKNICIKNNIFCVLNKYMLIKYNFCEKKYVV